MSLTSRGGVLISVALLSSMVACLSDKDRCLPGYVYLASYGACQEVADAAADAEASVDAAPASDGGGEAGGDGGTGLGDPCQDNASCTSKASYCLKNPQPPSDPGMCSIPQCTAADCGSTYACCDCGNAGLPDLKSWPRGVCVPRSNTSTLQSFGCTCL
jgi:hypothetical protein